MTRSRFVTLLFFILCGAVIGGVVGYYAPDLFGYLIVSILKK